MGSYLHHLKRKIKRGIERGLKERGLPKDTPVYLSEFVPNDLILDEQPQAEIMIVPTTWVEEVHK